MKWMKEGERLHAEPIHLNGILAFVIQPVPECDLYDRHGRSCPSDIATQSDHARKFATAVTSHSLRRVAQCLNAICHPGGPQ